MIIFSFEESILLLATMREVGHFGSTLGHDPGEVGRDPTPVPRVDRLKLGDSCQEHLRRLIQHAGTFETTLSSSYAVIILHHSPGGCCRLADHDIPQSNVSFFA